MSLNAFEILYRDIFWYKKSLLSVAASVKFAVISYTSSHDLTIKLPIGIFNLSHRGELDLIKGSIMPRPLDELILVYITQTTKFLQSYFCCPEIFADCPSFTRSDFQDELKSC